MFSSFFFFLL
uniref:Uncharacterized protein n=1 Tax=Rhizophora mucronata TaxID=61149 RepID=A0A2P2JD17_RHIMU